MICSVSSDSDEKQQPVNHFVICDVTVILEPCRLKIQMK